MDLKTAEKLLPLIISSKGEIDITVSGVSMIPTFMDGDIITVKSSNKYNIGDILIYPYKNEGLLVHRLLVKEDRYFCKGDNAFRLEDILPTKIIGKVIAINNNTVPEWDKWMLDLSLNVNREFIKCGYNANNTKQTKTYQLYDMMILKNKEGSKMFIKNNNLDFIQSDESSLAVFDAQTGNTYFFDEIGIDILNILEIPQTLDTLLNSLCVIYEATPNEILSDVEEFLAESVSNNIIEII